MLQPISPPISIWGRATFSLQETCLFINQILFNENAIEQGSQMMALDGNSADRRGLYLARQSVLKTVVECLLGLPEGNHLIPHGFRPSSLDQDACDKVGDSLHLGLVDAQAGMIYL